MRAIDADAMIDRLKEWDTKDKTDKALYNFTLNRINEQPTINPEPQEIGYDDCANALLKMWMDNVLTDGEYYRIANKLNVKWGKVELPEPYKGVTE